MVKKRGWARWHIPLVAIWAGAQCATWHASCAGRECAGGGAGGAGSGAVI
jgi:hypothetical protein